MKWKIQTLQKDSEIYIKFKVGSGARVRFWKDICLKDYIIWLINQHLMAEFLNLFAVSVGEMWKSETKSWKTLTRRNLLDVMANEFVDFFRPPINQLYVRMRGRKSGD